MQCMLISNKKIGWLIVCKYQCQYGPNDLPNVVKYISQNHNAAPTNQFEYQTWMHVITTMIFVK